MTHLARRMQRPYGKARSSACITQRMSSLRSASTSSINVPLVRPSIKHEPPVGLDYADSRSSADDLDDLYAGIDATDRPGGKCRIGGLTVVDISRGGRGSAQD
jgi:hypothetical protein